jgi:hypothetical protein
MSDGNGHSDALVPHDALVDELVLRYDRSTGSLEIGGHILNDDVGLGILQQAVRTFETRLRIAAAQAIQKQALDATRTQQILNSVRHGRG